MAKNILIYGDSNTHGYNAADGSRFDENTRWTGVCQNLLGDGYNIIEEGLNGRNTCHYIPEAEFLNGLKYITPCVLSKLPLDIICVKLGSNDFDLYLGQTPEMIASNAAKVLKTAKALAEEKYPELPCKYVLMAPLKITEDALTGDFCDSYNEETIEMSERAIDIYERVAAEEGFLFFDANMYAKCCKKDGVHLDAENHKKLGKAFAAWIKDLEEGR